MPQCIVLLFVVQFEFESLCSNLNLNVFVFLLEKNGKLFPLTLLVSSPSGPPLHLSLFFLFPSSRGPWSPVGPFSSPGLVRLPALSPALTDGWALPVGAVLLLAPDRDSSRARVRPRLASPRPSWRARQGFPPHPYKGQRPQSQTPRTRSRRPRPAGNPNRRRHWSSGARSHRR